MANRPTIRAYYRVTVTDASGRVVKRTRRRLSRSFVEQWIQGWRMFFVSANEANVDDTGGVARILRGPLAGNQEFGSANAPATTDVSGIVVGSDNTPVTITDDSLNTQIVHGAGAGQLNYGASAFGVITAVAGIAEFTFSRSFANASGGDVTVREIGVYCRGVDSVAAIRFFMLLRDIPTPEVVANTRTISVEYTVRISI